MLWRWGVGWGSVFTSLHVICAFFSRDLLLNFLNVSCDRLMKLADFVSTTACAKFTIYVISRYQLITSAISSHNHLSKFVIFLSRLTDEILIFIRTLIKFSIFSAIVWLNSQFFLSAKVWWNLQYFFLRLMDNFFFLWSVLNDIFSPTDRRKSQFFWLSNDELIILHDVSTKKEVEGFTKIKRHSRTNHMHVKRVKVEDTIQIFFYVGFSYVVQDMQHSKLFLTLCLS